MKRLHIMLLVFFVICFVADSIIAAYNYTNLRYISKGLLMPLLLAFFVTGIDGYLIKLNRQYITPVCLSLIFCFLGDVFLVDNSNKRFILGIASFLIAHIFNKVGTDVGALRTMVKSDLLKVFLAVDAGTLKNTSAMK